MMKIHTVLGEIEPGELGATACHEHLIWAAPEPCADDDPDLGLASLPAAVAELRHFKAAGGRAVVEMTTAEIGRCPLELRQISQAAGVHVIAAAGRHEPGRAGATLARLAEDELAAQIIAEINTGMDGTPVQAGVICACASAGSAGASAADERRMLRAAAQAQAATGAPLCALPENGAPAVELAAVLIQAGATPEKLLIGRLDRCLPLQVYLDLAQMGVYLGLDRVGQHDGFSDAERIALIGVLAHSGYAQQIILSSDASRRSAWHTHNPHAEGIARLPARFIPALRAAGLGEDALHALLVENPARFLAF